MFLNNCGDRAKLQLDTRLSLHNLTMDAIINPCERFVLTEDRIKNS